MKSRERLSLLEALKDTLREWTLVLIPVVADYVKATAYEWNCEGETPLFISKTTIESPSLVPLGKWLHVRSKFPISADPKQWALDLVFNTSPLTLAEMWTMRTEYLQIGVASGNN